MPPPPPGSLPLPLSMPAGRASLPGTNGFAIAALCCGIFGLFAVSLVLAIVFGFVALHQIRVRPQRGRGLAIAGIVLGGLWLVGLVTLIAVGLATSEPDRNVAGEVTSEGRISIGSLRAGDCFDGAPSEEDLAGGTPLYSVTVKPCTAPHEAEVGAKVMLPEGAFPGDDEAFEIASGACADKLDPLLREDVIDDVDLIVLYPNSALSWRADRSAICILVGLEDSLTDSVLV